MLPWLRKCKWSNRFVWKYPQMKGNILNCRKCCSTEPTFLNVSWLSKYIWSGLYYYFPVRCSPQPVWSACGWPRWLGSWASAAACCCGCCWSVPGSAGQTCSILPEMSRSPLSKITTKKLYSLTAIVLIFHCLILSLLLSYIYLTSERPLVNLNCRSSLMDKNLPEDHRTHLWAQSAVTLVSEYRVSQLL